MTAGSDYSEVIAVDVALRRGAFSLEAAFTAGLGLTALFGRSGSGKTTLIDLIAGLATPDRGRIAVAGHVLVDRRARIVLPPHRRRVGVVFQDARLFPHLSVAQNLAYGRVFARLPHDPAEFDAVTGMLGIGPLLARQPAGLSGGERQRVAIGRALLARPRLLLMDEPLAALDEGRKAEILPYIERLRDEAGVPIVYVSHSVAEVARLAGTIVVLDAGRVAATGPAEEILRRADLIPLHGEPGALLDMIVEGRDPRTGLTRLTGQAGMLLVPDLARPKGATVRVRIPARDVLVATEAPQGLSARNTLPGRVLALASAGTGVLVEIDCAGAILTAQLTEAAVRDLGLVPGREVVAIIKSAAFDPAGFGTGRPTIAI
ncbi:molybdenum ABC transporter ATP-binding protein [Methylobacterium persicinum]|uniref:Molybdate transport system ATP-binding protein n=1 Tax=Methylobacterium persicinum TaxID=374426 RepID=A0ABU0HQN0_9HYPH|nr:molybdenum ABC transporter ATP-binding protein [Methylobacterium persicinum]MDQ0444634.1 molybdate transport system ATP-binding protein [Methylobacterium persicinum]GJE38587.1 Vitamin B12 import ATP-binding protein BtuD [Methylobacterium persicinum]